MMTRLLTALLLISTTVFADAEQDITEVVSDLATALSENRPEQFLKMLDRNMPVYQQIERQLTGLATDTDIGCTIELIGNTGSGTAQRADLDWYMVLRSRQDQNLIERRRTKVTVEIEKRGKKWFVTAFSPVTLFAPMTVR
jgi:hypothetical protein